MDASDCKECCSGGACSPDESRCDVVGGNSYTCGNGAYQYNQRHAKCEVIPVGGSVIIDLTSYEQCDGATNSMDTFKRFYLVNKGAKNCSDSILTITTASAVFSGQAGPGGDVFTASESYAGWAATTITIANGGTKPVEVCYVILGVKD